LVLVDAGLEKVHWDEGAEKAGELGPELVVDEVFS